MKTPFRIQKYKKKCQQIFNNLWLHIQHVLFDASDKYKVFRIVYGGFYGIFLAFIFWNFVLFNLGLPEYIACLLFIFILVFLGLFFNSHYVPNDKYYFTGFGYAFSIKIRCICLLICLGFFGKAGRSVLKAIVFALIISGKHSLPSLILKVANTNNLLSGPLHNLTQNGKEVIRVFECSAKLTYNLTKTRFDLMTKPFYNSLYGLKQNLTKIEHSFKIIKNVIEPITNELAADNNKTLKRSLNNLDGDDRVQDAISQQNVYIAKIEKRCKLQMSKGVARCKSAFNDAFQKCSDRLPMLINSLLCWPIKITVVCNMGDLFGSTSNMCNPSNEIDPELGTNFIELKSILSNFSDVKLNYTTIKKSQIDSVKR